MGPRAISAGVDVGIKQDFTAVVICEVLQRPRADGRPPQPPYHADEVEQETYFHVQRILQLPHELSTFRQQAETIAGVLTAVRAAIADTWNPHGFAPLEIPPRDVYVDST